MPIVYGSSSNLLSIRKKKLIYCLESTASICIVLQHCFAYKKEFFGTPEALSLPRLLTLFHPPLSNGGFQEVTFFFWRPACYFGLYFPADCSRFLPRSPVASLLLLHSSKTPTQSTGALWLLRVAMERADHWQPFGSLNGWPRKCQLLTVATNYKNLANAVISHLKCTV